MIKKIILLSFMIILFSHTNQSFADNDKLVILHTQSGDITIEFFTEDAPKHVENFIKLAESGFYDRTVFHRVIKDFMIQGGDPKTTPGGYQSISEWGTGDPGYSIDAEFNDIKHNRGIVSMARAMDPNSAGSQFFIVHKDSNFLDGQYTVFGRIVTQESFETLDKIANLETPPDGSIPFDWGKGEILSAEVVDRSDVPNMLTLGEPERTTVEKTESGPYTNKKLGISFMAPEGWLLQELQKTSPNVPDVVAVGPKIDGMSATLTLSVVYSDGRSLEEKIAESRNNLKSSIDAGELQIISEKEEKIQNKESFITEAIGKFDVKNSTVNVKFREIVISTPEKFYTFTYSNSEENFDRYLEEFETTVGSFKILNEPEKESESPYQDFGENNKEGGGCLIATAAFGSELAPQVQQLREIRDNIVLSTHSGTAFMTGFNQLYYSFSPAIADYERENPIFKEAVKLAITPMLSTLSILNHVDVDSEEEMLGYGVGIIMLNAGIYIVGPAILIYRIRK
ncbi:peptidylprolyl isomerase [Nitrosopumilus sp. b1]|uniref:peptidylprolyl isomerase n=1 Tax=Nitrosopumilus sp. b1 TaxID=2109907 RepID=UPI0015F55CC2|nr:peptidylprolyl isomerase [Nitrosopumilus sp. b1]KAF6243019.1 peptidylprolyl isomerase [Nitrosopumilus sp. b1]